MTDDRVRLALDGPIARLTLRRPDKLNALDRAMILALAGAAETIEAAPEVRVAILSGEGKAFCAGGDIAAWSDLPPLDMWRDWTRLGHRAFEVLARLRVPMVAALTGHTFGGGLELAATADIRNAEAGIKLGLPETGLGMAPAGRGRNASFGVSAPRRCAAWLWAAGCSRPTKPWRSDWSTKWSQRAKGWPAPKRLPTPSPRADRSQCKSSNR
jgi:enoyl-CoA hydratase